MCLVDGKRGIYAVVDGPTSFEEWSQTHTIGQLFVEGETHVVYELVGPGTAEVVWYPLEEMVPNLDLAEKIEAVVVEALAKDGKINLAPECSVYSIVKVLSPTEYAELKCGTPLLYHAGGGDELTIAEVTVVAGPSQIGLQKFPEEQEMTFYDAVVVKIDRFIYLGDAVDDIGEDISAGEEETLFAIRTELLHRPDSPAA